jgi:hypothetical protein
MSDERVTARMAVEMFTVEMENRIISFGLDPRESAHVVLGKALIHRLDIWIKAREKMAELPFRIAPEIEELHRWVMPVILKYAQVKNTAASANAASRQLFNLAVKAGMDPKEAMKHSYGKRRGRRADRRELSLAAHDAKYVLGRSWPEVAQELCDCKKVRHDDPLDDSCSERLRVG